jgi:hypothetical protein
MQKKKKNAKGFNIPLTIQSTNAAPATDWKQFGRNTTESAYTDWLLVVRKRSAAEGLKIVR